jgi:hypothetical protein
MLQEHAFFSRPLVFFGSPQNIDEEAEEAEWSFADPQHVFLQTNRPLNAQPRIGLCIHWEDLNE